MATAVVGNFHRAHSRPRASVLWRRPRLGSWILTIGPTAVAYADTAVVTFTTPTGGPWTHVVVEISPLAPTDAAYANRYYTTIAATTVLIDSASLPTSSVPNPWGSGWNNALFNIALQARVRGYNTAGNTYGPWSSFGPAFTIRPDNIATAAQARIVGAQNPDGVAIGIPAGGAALSTYAGPTTITVNTTLDRQVFIGGLQIGDATHNPVVTITNSLVLPAAWPTVDWLNGANGQIFIDTSRTTSGSVSLDHCQLYGGGPGGIEYAIFGGQNCTITNSIVHGCVRLGNLFANGGPAPAVCNFSMTDSAIFDLQYSSYNVEQSLLPSGTHHSCMQVSNGTTFVFRRVKMWNPDGQTGASLIQPYQAGRSVATVTIDDCWIGGGGYAFEVLGPGTNGNDYVITNNKIMRFPHGAFYRAGDFGTTNIQPSTAGWTVSGNVWWEPLDTWNGSTLVTNHASVPITPPASTTTPPGL